MFGLPIGIVGSVSLKEHIAQANVPAEPVAQVLYTNESYLILASGLVFDAQTVFCCRMFEFLSSE